MNTLKTAGLAAVALGALSSFGMLKDEEALKAARETLAKMTLEEKTMMLGGSGTMTLAAIPRVGIMKEWTMSDNSSTVRPQMTRWSWDYTQPKTENTKLPSLSALAQTWDTSLAKRHGETLGAEMRERRERGELRVLALRFRVAPVPAVHLRTDRRRVVAHRPLLHDADARNRREGHRAGSAEHHRLLLERHLRKDLARRLQRLVVREHRPRPGRRGNRQRRHHHLECRVFHGRLNYITSAAGASAA